MVNGNQVYEMLKPFTGQNECAAKSAESAENRFEGIAASAISAVNRYKMLIPLGTITIPPDELVKRFLSSSGS